MANTDGGQGDIAAQPKKSKPKKDPEVVTKMFVIDVFVREEGLKQQILNSIKLYRHAGRQLVGTFFTACAAGASVQEKKGDLVIKPENARARQILDLAMDKSGKLEMYSCRDVVLQHWAKGSGKGGGKGGGNTSRWHSYVWDSLRRKVWSLWQAKDPQFQKAARGWLVLQGVRRLPVMNGIGIETPAVYVRKLDHHSVELQWDHEIGPVTLHFTKLDGGRWAVWKAILEDRYKIGSVTLNYRRTKKGPQLKLYMPYKYRRKKRDISPKRSIEVSFDHDTGITVTMLEGKHDSQAAVPPDDLRKVVLPFAAAISGIDQLKTQDETLLAKLRACGNRGECRRGQGCPAAANAFVARRKKVSLQRERRVKDWNHRWTSRIAAVAESWQCGKCVLFDIPETIRKRPWQWFHFQQMLQYKLHELGCTMDVVVSENADKAYAAIAQGAPPERRNHETGNNQSGRNSGKRIRSLNARCAHDSGHIQEENRGMGGRPGADEPGTDQALQAGRQGPTDVQPDRDVDRDRTRQSGAVLGRAAGAS